MRSTQNANTYLLNYFIDLLSQMEILVLPTQDTHIPHIQLVDEYYEHHQERHLEAIETKTHYSARSWDTMIGLIICWYRLVWNAYIELLMTHPDYRRQWVATQLIQYCKEQCTQDTLFVSTQQSNNAMIALLEKLSFASCGSVQYLNEDPSDDELFFVTRCT